MTVAAVPPGGVAAIRRALAAGEASVTDVVAGAYERLAAMHDDAVLISQRPVDEAVDLARSAADEGRPWAGVPFVVKDNIDVAGLPTTAACRSYTRVPTRSATAVARLEEAGAVVIGKSNLDQFATGLAGTRSPYGTPRNPVDAGFVPGGSSSGSAVVVAAGAVPFALGTDTAGSGRVPAGFCGVVGLKPTVGLVPTDGVVPAVAELDCVTVFVGTAHDGVAVLGRMSGIHEAAEPPPVPGWLRVGVPSTAGLAACDDSTRRAFDAAVAALVAAGHEPVEVDIDPLLAVGRLLYAPGPWLGARYEAFGEHLAAHPEDADPTVAEIVLAAGGPPDPARDAAARAELARLRPAATALFGSVDVLALPVTPSIPTLRSALADPVGTSRHLGTYTNFVNLLGWSAASVPVGPRDLGLPAGLMLVGPAGADAVLGRLAGSLAAVRPPEPGPAAPGEVDLVVVGAHLGGLPLNPQLTDRGARFVRATTTTADYRLVALADSLPPNPGPPRPGLVRVAPATGGEVAVEVWRLTTAALGSFMTGVPAPLGIGTVVLRDGSTPLGFICEGIGAEGAPDLTAWRGWRAWLADGAPVP